MWYRRDQPSGRVHGRDQLMIENEQQLRYSVEQVARMYRLRDREAAETLWDPETRDDIVEGTESMIRKVEREIAEYLAQKYDLLPQPGELPAEEAEKVALIP